MSSLRHRDLVVLQRAEHWISAGHREGSVNTQAPEDYLGTEGWHGRITDSWLGNAQGKLGLGHGKLPSGLHSPAMVCSVLCQCGPRVTSAQGGYCRIIQDGDSGLAVHVPVEAEAT